MPSGMVIHGARSVAEAMVVRPIWEEFALYSDCDLHGSIAVTVQGVVGLR
jgi:hypothetical protein